MLDNLRIENGQLEFDYTGNTEVDWNSQRTLTEDGQRVFVDGQGETFLEWEILRQPPPLQTGQQIVAQLAVFRDGPLDCWHDYNTRKTAEIRADAERVLVTLQGTGDYRPEVRIEATDTGWLVCAYDDDDEPFAMHRIPYDNENS